MKDMQETKQIAYVAFLRGINVSSNKRISMRDIVNLFEKSGFKNTKTILATGNVVFEAKKNLEMMLAQKIEKAIQDSFGFEVVVQVKQLEEMKRLIEKNPFRSEKADKDIHWYVTFLENFDSRLPKVKSDYFTFLSVQNSILFSTLDTQKGKSTDFINFLDKTFSKKITTRNWNTLLKIAKIR